MSLVQTYPFVFSIVERQQIRRSQSNIPFIPLFLRDLLKKEVALTRFPELPFFSLLVW